MSEDTPKFYKALRRRHRAAIRLMREHPGDMEMQLRGVSVLYCVRVGSCDVCEEIVQAGGMECICDAMRSFPRVAILQCRALVVAAEIMRTSRRGHARARLCDLMALAEAALRWLPGRNATEFFVVLLETHSSVELSWAEAATAGVASSPGPCMELLYHIDIIARPSEEAATSQATAALAAATAAPESAVRLLRLLWCSGAALACTERVSVLVDCMSAKPDCVRLCIDAMLAIRAAYEAPPRAYSDVPGSIVDACLGALRRHGPLVQNSAFPLLERVTRTPSGRMAGRDVKALLTQQIEQSGAALIESRCRGNIALNRMYHESRDYVNIRATTDVMVTFGARAITVAHLAVGDFHGDAAVALPAHDPRYRPVRPGPDQAAKSTMVSTNAYRFRLGMPPAAGGYAPRTPHKYIKIKV